ncbi:MAG: hypothetical protein RLZZ184_4257 [Cyanobacteriota bacterium]|jgi:glycosyltransferase involved in cell wall biosynthesis
MNNSLDLFKPDLPLISFILICYNQEKFIQEALAGAFSQTYSNLEIIISDDFSSDKTFDIVRNELKKYKGNHIVKVNRNEENLGISENINRAVGLSHGKLLVLAAGDDISLPQRCEILHQAFLLHPDAMAITSAWVKIDEYGCELPTILPNRYVNGRVDFHGECGWTSRFIKSNDIGTCGATSSWSRELFTKYGPIPVDVPAEDAVLSFRAYLSGSVVYLKDKLVKYRTHTNNIFGLSYTSLKHKEYHLQKFSERSAFTIKAEHEDFCKYQAFNTAGENIKNGIVFLNWASELQNSRSFWWNRSILWRLRKTLFSIFTLNISEAKWRGSRVFGIRFLTFVYLIKKTIYN